MIRQICPPHSRAAGKLRAAIAAVNAGEPLPEVIDRGSARRAALQLAVVASNAIVRQVQAAREVERAIAALALATAEAEAADLTSRAADLVAWRLREEGYAAGYVAGRAARGGQE